jgi:hypothetical protein
LHDHLIALGFDTIVATARDGSFLFFDPSEKGWRGPCANVSKKLAAFVREVVTDKRVQPNHAWRHLFKTRGQEAGIDGDVLDALCGQEPGRVGAAYGHANLAARIAAIDKLPRFEVS